MSNYIQSIITDNVKEDCYNPINGFDNHLKNVREYFNKESFYYKGVIAVSIFSSRIKLNK